MPGSLQETDTLMGATETRQPGAEEFSKPITQRVIETVTETIDTDPAKLDPLYETIDPDALEQVFRGSERGEGDRNARITFAYAGCEVTVYGNSEVEVTQLPDDQSDDADFVIGKSTSR